MSENSNGINIGYTGVSYAALFQRASTEEEVSARETAEISARPSKNTALFESLIRVESQVDAIVNRGVREYVSGIKQNIMQSVHAWTAGGCGQLFALYGMMGTGKSFFAANVYNTYRNDPLFDTVIFSSQQSYRETTDIRNLLLVTASRLSRCDSEFATYFQDTALAADDPELLTEQVLFAPFEGVNLRKKVLIILDGLDEFPAEECKQFLLAISDRITRLNPSVFIMFTSRPETHIRTSLRLSPRSIYNIAQNVSQSREDCVAFVRSKSSQLCVQLSRSAEEMLINRSEYSLKYLECVFSEAAQNGGVISDSMISELPFGLLNFYHSQLLRYFPENRLDFYREELMPLLEILCAAYRPLSIDEAADVLECSVEQISRLLLQSAPLLTKEDRVIRLFQMESFKLFLSDESLCPPEYLVFPENGHKRLKSRSQSSMSSNSYLSTYATEHTLSSSSGDDSGDDITALVRLLANNITDLDFVVRQCRILLEKPEEIIEKFILALFNDETVTEIAREFICLRLLACSTSYHREEKYLRVLDNLPERKDITICTLYARLRIARLERDIPKSQELLKLWEEIAADSAVNAFTRGNFEDEYARVAALQDDLQTAIEHMIETLRQHDIVRKDPATDEAARQILPRSFSVAYDQISRYARRLDKAEDNESTRKALATLARIFSETLPDPLPKHYAWLLSERLFRRELEYCEQSLEQDRNSKRRQFDITYALYELGKTYSDKDFPNYNIETAIEYFERVIAISQQLAAPEPAEQDGATYDRTLARSGISASNALIPIYLELKRFDEAKRLVDSQAEVRARAFAYYDDVTTAYDVCYWKEMTSDLIAKRDGFIAAVSEYDATAKCYAEGAARFKSETFIKAPAVVYSRIAGEYARLKQYDKQIEYLLLEQETRRKAPLKGYAAERNEWFLYASYERLGNAYKNSGEKYYDQAMAYYEKAEKGYQDLAKRVPQNEDYIVASDTVYGQMLNIYNGLRQYDKASALIARITPIFDQALADHPSIKTELSRNYIYECAANAICSQKGVLAAQQAYMQVVEAQIEGYKKWKHIDFRRRAERRCCDTARMLLNRGTQQAAYAALPFLRIEKKLREEDEKNGWCDSSHETAMTQLADRMSKAISYYGSTEKRTEALELCDTALAGYEKQKEKDPDIKLQSVFLSLYERKAKLLTDLGKPEEALAVIHIWSDLLQSAKEIQSKYLLPYFRRYISFNVALLLKHKDAEQAVAFVQKELTESEALMTPDETEDVLQYKERRELTRFLFETMGDLALHHPFNEKSMLRATEYYLLAKSL